MERTEITKAVTTHRDGLAKARMEGLTRRPISAAEAAWFKAVGIDEPRGAQS